MAKRTTIRCIQFIKDYKRGAIRFPINTILIIKKELKNDIICQWMGNEFMVPHSVITIVDLGFDDLLKKYNNLISAARPILEPN